MLREFLCYVTTSSLVPWRCPYSLSLPHLSTTVKPWTADFCSISWKFVCRKQITWAFQSCASNVIPSWLPFASKSVQLSWPILNVPRSWLTFDVFIFVTLKYAILRRRPDDRSVLLPPSNKKTGRTHESGSPVPMREPDNSVPEIYIHCGFHTFRPPTTLFIGVCMIVPKLLGNVSIITVIALKILHTRLPFPMNIKHGTNRFKIWQ